jgi:hypothetical protein
MKWSLLASQAKKVVDGRGGTDGLKRDAEKLREIATGQGTAKDKAQRAADHLKQSPKKPGEGADRSSPDQAGR